MQWEAQSSPEQGMSVAKHQRFCTNAPVETALWRHYSNLGGYRTHGSSAQPWRRTTRLSPIRRSAPEGPPRPLPASVKQPPSARRKIATCAGNPRCACTHAINAARSADHLDSRPREWPSGKEASAALRGALEAASAPTTVTQGSHGVRVHVRAYGTRCVVSSRPATLGRHRPARACVHAIRATALAAGR